MAVNLEAPDLLALWRSGTFPQAGWEVEAEEAALRATSELCRAIGSSLLIVSLAALLALVVVASAGLIALNLPFVIGKVVSALGGFLAGWATLFALGTPVRTWKGRSLTELVHPKVFTALFIPGFFFAFIGQLL